VEGDIIMYNQIRSENFQISAMEGLLSSKAVYFGYFIIGERDNIMEKKTVVVLFGGQSPEHEVSRVSAQFVLENLDPDKYEVLPVGITKKGRWLPFRGSYRHIGSGEWEGLAISDSSAGIEEKYSFCGTLNESLKSLTGLDKIDVVFPVLHGSNGEDGLLQGFLELAGIPYVGCNVLSSAVGMDKAVSKVLFEHAGLTQAKYFVLKRSDIETNYKEIEQKVSSEIGYPCFVKPSNAGSSVGITKVKEPDSLKPALYYAARYDRKILIEEYIDGREIECAVLGYNSPVASTVGEIIPCNEFYDYNAKYIDEDSEIIIPAQLDDETVETIRDYAVTAFNALDCSGLARVDFFVEKNTGKVYINEINTMPGFTSISMYPKLWAASGVDSRELLDRLINLAFERFNENQKSYER
jgi:D-alanine-D-alanine ligase